MMAPTLRLLADDLTGALDTAAEFVGLVGPVHAFWQGARPGTLPASAAIDTGTRESDEASARAITTGASATLAGATIAYKKVDSLIRGQTLAELAACYAAGPWRHAVLAPAFPFQGRVTRNAQQFVLSGDDRLPVGPRLVDAIARARIFYPLLFLLLFFLCPPGLAPPARPWNQASLYSMPRRTRTWMQSSPRSAWTRTCCGAAPADWRARWPAGIRIRC